MRQYRITFATIVLALSAGASGARAATQTITAAEAPKATPRLLRELERGEPQVRVIVGLLDGTAPPGAPEADPARELDRQARRLAAQKRLAESLPDEDFRPRHLYESFSLVSGTASRSGVLALTNRSEVAWVTTDGTKRLLQANPQNAQLLIRSDQTNAKGFTGVGQTIAVIDTGVDYRIPTLGGGPFPNAKIIGGIDVADKDGDPMDCEGHGTQVCGIIAGPTGVAPDAKLVAIKVFSSKNSSNSECKDEAFDSDILAGINYAVTHRATFGIAAINLSLGGSFDDGADHGYCDAQEVGYATAFDAATAAGIVVVAAAGNEGTTNSLAIPACLSSAVSVGAVYPDNHARVSWSDGKGGVRCTDQPAVPDQIVCFSNSNSSLALLAPGAFWRVPSKGGDVSTFHGTSAAAPTVAGAVALLRQARPELTPAGLSGMLGATGKPIADSRNGVTTPRVDTLAAVQVSSAGFASFGGGPVGIPDGGCCATATVTITDFPSPIAGVQAWVQIDHPNPAQLKLTLIGPDGSSAVLQDGRGRPQHPINAIYGKTEAPAQSFGIFQGKPGNGMWTLRVEGKVAGSIGRIRNFAVTLVPAPPVSAIPAAESGSVLPVVAHVAGTKLFLSDLRIYNPASSPRSFSLYYVGPGQNGGSAARVTQTVGAGQVLTLNDVISSEFGYADSFGQMTITSAEGNFLATSRAYTKGENGTFGLSVPSFPRSAGLGSDGGTATANGLSHSAQMHSNVGFAEVFGAPVTVQIDVRDSGGALLGSAVRSAEPNTTSLITDIIRDRELPPTSNFRADFTVVGGAGRIIPFATTVDDVTGDGSFQTAVAPVASSEDIILPPLAHVTGTNGGFFQTNLAITNLESQPITVTVSLLPIFVTGGPPAARVYALAPGQTLEKRDVLASEFGLSDPSAAALRIHALSPARLVVSARTFVRKFGGTFGYSVSGQPSSAAIGLGTTATVIDVDQTSARAGYRSNFGFTEIAGAPATVRVSAKSGSTGSTLGSKSYSIAANSSFQASVADILGASATASNIYLQFMVEAGAGRVLPYATVVDNTSGDAIFVPAQ